MSLRIWLPLTKDLRQQGLSNVTVTNNGATFNSAGKLGGCYYFNGNAYFSGNSLSATMKSAAFWMNLSNLNNSLIFVDYKSHLAFGIYNTYLICSCVESTGFRTCYNKNILTTNKWIHVAVTKTDTMYALYIDGVLQTPISTLDHWTTNITDKFTIGARSNGSTCMTGYINDFRLYDHCLSPMEVKELAKGLVLHYPLNRQGWGQENILTNSSGYQGTSYWNARVTVGNENGIPYIITKRTDTTTSSRLIYQHDSLTNYVSSWAPGDSFTISGYYKIPSTEEYEMAANLFIRWTRVSGENSYDDTGFYTSLSDEKDKWIRFEKTFVVPSNYQNGSVTFNLAAFSKGLSTVYWRYVKIEKGNKATPWCPNSSDTLATTMGLNSTTEYDCSGFGNNGTRTGTFTWTSDTPRYNSSTYFEDYTRKLRAPLVFTPTAITMTVWIKSSAIGRGSYHMPLNIDGGAYEFSIDSYGKFRNGFFINGSRVVDTMNSKNILDGQWHHLCATYDGTTIKRYVDGISVTGGDHAATGTLTGTSMLYVGTYGTSETYGNNQMYESDIRIYATALSADDVKSLYQNSAYIDSSGNVYGAVHEEV